MNRVNTSLISRKVSILPAVFEFDQVLSTRYFSLDTNSENTDWVTINSTFYSKHWVVCQYNLIAFKIVI